MSSFVRKAPGGRSDAAYRGGQAAAGCRTTSSDILVTSSGVPSFDALFAEGIPMGTINLVHEDWPRSASNYSSTLLKCILAEGLVNGQDVYYLEGVENDSQLFLSRLPSPITKPPRDSSVAKEGASPDDKMTIAWRYKHLQKLDPSLGPAREAQGSRYFDLGGKLNSERTVNSFSVHDPDSMTQLIEVLQNTVAKISRDTALRVVIRSLGSPYFGELDSLVRFLCNLQKLVFAHSKNVVVFISVPAYLFAANPEGLARLHYFADSIVELESFARYEGQKNKSLAEYDGFLHIIKPLRSPNSLALMVPESVNLTFKIRRRQLLFETFHLPPAFEEAATDAGETSQAFSASRGAVSPGGGGCGHTASPLDF